MAETTKKPATEQPANGKAKKPATKAQPATGQKPAAQAEGVTLRMLADKLGAKSEKTLRARIRRINGGPVVGRGGRYHWDSWNDKDLKVLIEKLSTKEDVKTSA